MTVRDGLLADSAFKSETKLLKKIKELLLEHADEEYTENLFKECDQKARADCECENDSNKGKYIMNHSMYCETCFKI
jgi:hypothetical protein